MKRKIISLLLAVIMLAVPFMSVSAGYYKPGPQTYDMEQKYCIESEGAEVSGTQIVVNGEGKVTYDYYICFDATYNQLLYTNAEAGKVIIFPEGNEPKTFDIAEGTGSVKYDFAHAQEMGDNVLRLEFSGNITVTAVRFKQVMWLSNYNTEESANQVMTDMSDEEWAISTAVLIKNDATIIMVDGSRRFINDHDMTARPLIVDGTTYLPIKVLAYALGYYHEDKPDKNYFLMRIDQTTFMWKDGVFTKQVDHNEIEQMTITPQYIDGETWVPVRFFAEQAGEHVFYRDGVIVFEQSKHLGKDIVENDTNFNYVLKEFEAFTKLPTVGTTFYVAKTEAANDENPGTKEDPFKTINKAAAVAKAGDTVIIGGGTYRETVVMKNDGTETSPIIFKAADGEKVTVKATEKIDDFITLENGQLAASIPWDLGMGRNQVFYNDECIIEARYPNEPGTPMLEGEELSALYPVRGDFLIPKDNDKLVTSETLLNQEEDDYWKGAMYISMHGYAWTLGAAVVESSTKGSLTLTDTCERFWYAPKGESGKLNFGYIAGHKNAMDLPGEWVMDNNVLFIIPPEGETADTLSLEVKQRQLCFDFSNRKFVQIHGIDIFGGSIKMQDSEMCMVDDMDAKYVTHYTYSEDYREGFINGYLDGQRADKNASAYCGESGIYVGGIDNKILNSRIDHSAGAGLMLYGVYGYVENNIISNTGYMGSYVSGITLGAEGFKALRAPRGGHAVYNNTVYNAGRSVLNLQMPEGKVPGWEDKSWSPPILPYEIAYNDLHNGMLFSLDGGVTYDYVSQVRTTRDESAKHHNYIYTTYPEDCPWGLGLYHDGKTVGHGDYDNIVFTTAPDSRFSMEYVVYTVMNDNHANYVRRNMALYLDVVEGGPRNLKTDQYPYALPFYAGTYQDEAKDPFMKNYNEESKNNSLIYATEAVLGEGVEFNEQGHAVLEKNDEYIEFKDVDFGEEGKNFVDIYFTGDIYKGSTNLELGVGESLETAEFTLDKLAPNGITIDELDLQTLNFVRKSGKTNFYIRKKNGGTITIDSVRFGSNASQQGNVLLDGSHIFGGEATSIVKAGSQSMPPQLTNPGYGGFSYLARIWTGSQVLYKRVNVPKNANYFFFATGTQGEHAGQELIFSYLKSTDPSYTEFARVYTPDNSWESNKDDRRYIKLDNMPSGEMQILLTTGGKNQTCNLYRFGFVSELPEGAKLEEYPSNK